MCAALYILLGKRFLLHRGTPKLEHSYYSGGSGYVLSRGALRLLVCYPTTVLSSFMCARVTLAGPVMGSVDLVAPKMCALTSHLAWDP